MTHKGPLVRKRPRKRNRDGTWRKKRSDAGKKRENTMSNNARNTQFSGFAKALWQEIAFTHGDNVQRDVAYNIKVIEELIARRVYDLACHVVTHCDEDIAWRKSKGYSIGQIVENDVPDMTELPKEQEEPTKPTAEEVNAMLDRHNSMYSVDLGDYQGAEALEVLQDPEQEALGHVEECLANLHTSIFCIVPQEAATGPAGIFSQMQIAENVKEDFKKLSDAIKALRKE